MRYFSNPIGFLDRCARRYGDTFSVRLAGFPHAVFVSHPDAIKQISMADFDLLGAGRTQQRLAPLLGSNSMLLLDGEPYLRHRRLLLPPFHGNRMALYGEMMQAITRDSMERWPANQAFRLQPRIQAITLDVMMRAVFGLESPERDRLSSLLIELFSPSRLVALQLPPFARRLPLSPYRVFTRTREAVDRVLEEIIEARLADAHATQRIDVMSLLLAARDEEGQPLTFRELRDELLTLLAAGSETTATTICWAVQRVLANPSVADRLFAELDDAGGPALAASEMNALPYLSAVVKETLRLHPPALGVIREVQAPYSIDGYCLPVGTYLTGCLYLLHRRADLYPDPERFVPERFVDSTPPAYAWLPFGIGLRRCVGMAFARYQMAVVLGTVLSSTRMRLCRPPARPARQGLMIGPKDRLQVVIERKLPSSGRGRPRQPNPDSVARAKGELG